MQRFLKILLAATLAATPAVVEAQSSAWYFSAGVGYSEADSDAQPFGQNIAIDPDFPQDWETDSDSAYFLGLGYAVSDNFRLELRYSDRSVETDDTNFGTGARDGFDYNVQFEAGVPVWTLEAFYDFRAGEAFRPYIKVGAGYATTESQATLVSDTDPLFPLVLGPLGFLNEDGRYPYFEQSEDNFAWVVGLGFRLRLSERFDLIAEVQHLNVGDVRTAADDFTDGFAIEDLALNEASVGLNLRF
ncbi:MAG: outer membrane beta-barrel protein [Acidobacteriota bacterium]